MGTVTDENGNFSITVPDDAVLVISSIGYEPQEIAVSGKTFVAVSLKQSEKIQDAVVVIGYGTAVKRDLTGSIVKVAGKEVADKPNTNPVASLQGKVAGSDPLSIKIGGFVRGAGHGSTFQDNRGNWWHVATTVISVKNTFERRIAMWPAGFDKDDVIWCNTSFGDYPHYLPAYAPPSIRKCKNPLMMAKGILPIGCY